MIKPDAPCKGCKERNINCHSVCNKYLTYKEEMKLFTKQYYEKEKLNNDLIGYEIEKKRKIKKTHKKRS